MTAAILSTPVGVAKIAPPASAAAKTVRPWRWTRMQYYAMWEAGIFPSSAKTQLIDGVVEEMPPPSNRHALGVDLLRDLLQRGFGDRFWVRGQHGLDLTDESAPLPDLAVVEGDMRDYRGRDDNPTTALLVVEVSNTSYRVDSRRKSSLYSSVGIPEYWILNYPDGVLEVYRNPRPDPIAEFGASYASMTTLRAGDTVSPLAAPHATIAVADVLPG